MNLWSEFLRGVTKDNPVFALLLGLCPTLAVTTSMENGIGMAAASMFVLLCANIIISSLKNHIPPTIRVPIFILVIATFVSIIGMVMEAFTPALHTALGVFVPLIVVNCMIIGRAEAYASKNPVSFSVADGLGIGTGFLLVLAAIGAIRELFGTGEIVLFGLTLIQMPIEASTFMIMPPGAFFTIAVLMALVNYRRAKLLERGG
ncbi:electron transport complex, RnfABCDGE type, E subunit [Methanosalsum zhilinae DSM 4017]|uniref:Ion-translocating oxidoreductase complex subunit E n=1 Tax=Methanosalsum zhilinae (strain DSM 4017 / NBRC 107636 / OCM 62 / WeN5) TaxID=679901 RepID=F7XPN3_METZD|nr:Rnf electron transport complex subunit RnfE [Methanosalsum zhilinae]AEH60303.1 electron transport complex, RnfABCDGE type, E subunit [Methanosalsum zhilinae DSM 4017]